MSVPLSVVLIVIALAWVATASALGAALGRWLARRRTPDAPSIPPPACPICNRPAGHEVREVHANIPGERMEGGTSTGVDWCADHCPGGCQHDCPVREVDLLAEFKAHQAEVRAMKRPTK